MQIKCNYRSAGKTIQCFTNADGEFPVLKWISIFIFRFNQKHLMFRLSPSSPEYTDDNNEAIVYGI